VGVVINEASDSMNDGEEFAFLPKILSKASAGSVSPHGTVKITLS
jgi:hypothetical protein